MIGNFGKSRTLLLATTAWASVASGVSAQAQDATVTPPTPADEVPQTGSVDSPTAPGEPGEIIVSARRRNERLLDVPVSVTALGEQALERYSADSLATVTETIPTVSIASYNTNGGGTISIRGVGTPGSQGGFEQAVSLVVDGVPISSARLVVLGYFDLQQVEVLKGPQALFFGKNSPAGVISLNSKNPTDGFAGEVRGSYEFVGDEAIAEGIVSGPLGGNFSGRAALRYRNLKGWLYNDARAIPNNPFNAAAPLPGSFDRRNGDRELLGRLSLRYDGGDFDATLKVAGQRLRADGPSSQNIGPCPTGRPLVFAAGVLATDPFGECKPDNHYTNGNPPVSVGSTLIDYDEDGAYVRDNTLLVALNANMALGNLQLSSTSGYIYYKQRLYTGFDQTTYSSLLFSERDSSDIFSQELRLTSDYQGPFNFLVGGFYQHATNPRSTDLQLNNSTNLALPLGSRCFNPAVNSFSCYTKETNQVGSTVSAFGQLTYRPAPALELSGGVRYTQERKRTRQAQVYGVGNFDVSNTVIPGSLDPKPGTIVAKYKDSNWSPEATISYHPTANSTIYAAYKTGYKSGGFGNSGPFTRAQTVAAISFGPERVKGFELGAKGRSGPLRVEATAFAYDFTDLQVNTFDAATITFKIANAGKLVQRGFDLQGELEASDQLSLRANVAYTRNRFKDYIGQCYNIRFPAGTTRTQLGGAPAGTAPIAPSGCQFGAATGLTLAQDFDGRAPARSPDWAASAGFTFEMPMGSMGLTFNGDAIYSDGYFPGETMPPGTRQDSFIKLNGSIQLNGPDSRWGLSLIGRNLTNEYVTVFSAERSNGLGVVLSPNESRGVVTRGREVTVQARYSF